MDLNEFPGWMGTLGKVVTLGGVAYGFWQYVVRPCKKFVSSVNETTTKLSRSLPTLLGIAEQFRPNGGNSLYDIINDIRDKSALNTQGYRSIFHCMDVAFFEADIAGGYTFVSKRWCEITGMYPEQARGDGWINAIEADLRDNVMIAWKHAVTDKREFDLELRVIHSENRQAAAVRVRGFPALRPDKLGKEILVGFTGVMITKQQIVA